MDSFSSSVLTVASGALVARIARARVAVDVVGTRAVKTRAAATLVDVSCKQCTFDFYTKLGQNAKCGRKSTSKLYVVIF